MVIRCVSCKTYNYDFKDQNLTFHKVPDQPEIRSEWLFLLGISEHSKPLAKVLHLCSNHFYPSDFIVGSKRLKTGALPHPANLPANPGSNENDNADYPSTSKLSDSSDTDTASEPLGNPQLCKIAVIGSVKKRVTERLSDVSLGIKPLHWSSDTLTASDEDPSTATAIQAPMPVAVSRKRSNENDNADYPSPSKLSDSSETDTASEPLGNPQLCKIAVIGSVKKRQIKMLSVAKSRWMPGDIQYQLLHKDSIEIHAWLF